VRVRVLGSAAGGGFPQWNCHCETCEAARAGVRARPRTQSSLAIRGAQGPWFLVNASPDARQQLEALTPGQVDGVRSPPIAGVLLTDAEIDHTAGLLLMRESQAPVRVFGDQGVEQALRRGYPVLEILERYCGAEWQTLEREQARSLEGSSLTVEPFETGGDAPRYLDGSDVELQASGFVFRDSASGGVLTYAPGLARLDDGVLSRLAASDLVLVDGTFWRDDELARIGIVARSARDMGHLPLSGPGGTLEALARMERPRKVLVHINNTNPILFEDSPERKAVRGAGIEVAYDGLEIAL
jgi:pyrroloquinoline quinone biosynthesis protein B